MLGGQTKQAAFSRATVVHWIASQRVELDLQIKEGHLRPTWCMEKHNSLKAPPSKVDLLLHNINNFYAFFMDLVMFRKSLRVSFMWEVGSVDYIITPVQVNFSLSL